MKTIDTSKWVLFGTQRNVWGELEEVGLPLADLTTHTVVSGSTGSGKSTFLRGLAKQVFAMGGTVIVLEPHGDLIVEEQEGILADLPPELLDRVAVLDFVSPMPPQLNLTTMDLPRGRSLAVDSAMSSIEVVEAAGWEKGVRIREILEHTMHLVLERSRMPGVRQASMLDAQIFLTDTQKREQWLRNLKGSGKEEDQWRIEELGESIPYLEGLFASLENGKSKGESVLEYPVRRVGRFFRNDYLRRSLALPLLNPKHAFDLEALMNDKRGTMILVPLRAKDLGDDAKRVIATLLMQSICKIYLSRGDIARSERQQTMIIIDEFADLAGTGVGPIIQTLLAQARKFGASIVLATQSLSQLPKEVAMEVKVNTNNKVVLRLAEKDDAQAGIAMLGTPLLQVEDLTTMERWSGYARTLTHGEPQPPYYFQSLPPVHIRSTGRRRFYNLPECPIQPKLAEIWEYAASDPTRAARAIGELSKMDAPTFQTMVQAQWEQQEYERYTLLERPELEPHPVQRALRISRNRFGLPWWFYEAQYRRLRFRGQET
jgi:hypothetical protein